MKLNLLLIFLFIQLLAAGQSNQFLIYSMKGQVIIKENGNETKAKVGHLLSPNASLEIGANSIVTLICDQINLFSIDKKGKYNLTAYTDSCKKNYGSFTGNYLRYVWAQMSQKQTSPGTNRKLYMNTIGAVSRSVNNIWIDPRLDTIIYSDGYFPLAWKSYAEADRFDFYMYDNNTKGNVLFSDSTSEMQVAINTLQHLLKPGYYFWSAAVIGQQNEERIVLKIVTTKERDQLIDRLRNITLAYESEAETAFRLGFQLEEAHYLADAYNYYQKAATLQPDQPVYRQTFMSFKKDYDIK